MTDASTIDRIANDIASKKLGSANLDHVSSSPSVDSEGNDAIRILITLKPDVAKSLNGDDVLDTLVDIQNALADTGDFRLPIIEYSEVNEVSETEAEPVRGRSKS